MMMNINMVRTTTITRTVTNRIICTSCSNSRKRMLLIDNNKRRMFSTITNDNTLFHRFCTSISNSHSHTCTSRNNHNHKQYNRKNDYTSLFLQNHNYYITINNTKTSFLTIRLFSSSSTSSSKTTTTTLNTNNDKKEEVKVCSTSTSTTSTNNTTATNNNDFKFTGDIIQGPAIIRTSLSYYNRPNPTILYLPGVRSLPFWSQLHVQQDQSSANKSTTTTRIAYNDPTISSIVQLLESNCHIISSEYLNNVDKNIPSDYQMALPSTVTNTTTSTSNTTTASTKNTTKNTTTTNEHTLHNGRWDWHSYMLKGKVITDDTNTTEQKQKQEQETVFQKYYPETTKIIQQIQQSSNLFEHVPFGYTFFSTLYPQTSIVSHYGPTNLRIRLHLPILVPNNTNATTNEHDPIGKQNEEENDKPICGIRVGTNIRQWHYGKVLVFDDSYNHEVWNNSLTDKRVILLVDIWHPDITQQERSDIIGMFQHAQDQGWL